MERDERPVGPRWPAEPRRILTGWTPGAIAGIVAGLFLAVLGMLVLIDAGLHPGSLTSRTGTALSFTQSELLAIVEIGFGIALAGWATSLAGVFGGDPASGWLWIGVGVVTVVAALIPRHGASRRTAATADLESPTAPAKQAPWRRAG